MARSQRIGCDLLGTRGARAKRDHAARALRAGIGWTALAVASGKAGMWLGGPVVWTASVLPLLLLMVWLPFALRGAEKTALGELVASSTLAAAAIPVAVAGGLDLAAGHLVWAAWTLALATSSAAVRWVITRHKHDRGERVSFAIVTLSTAALAPLTLISPVAWAALPMVIAGWLLIARPPHPRRLKRVGWTLMGCSALSAALAVGIVRVSERGALADQARPLLHQS